MDILDDEWLKLIGVSKESEDFIKFISEKGLKLSESEQKSFKNTTLYNFYNDGISFAFVDGKLDSIDFYQTDKKFKPVNPEFLPFGITNKATGKDLVNKFGEPIEKGGGLSSRMDIWLRWNQLQVEMDEMSWDSAKDVTWKSITIFEN